MAYLILRTMHTTGQQHTALIHTIRKQICHTITQTLKRDTLHFGLDIVRVRILRLITFPLIKVKVEMIRKLMK